MSEAIHDWDGWLYRLVEEEAARKVADIRAYLIAEISRAMSHSTTGDRSRSARRDRRRHDDRVHNQDPIPAKLIDGELAGQQRRHVTP